MAASLFTPDRAHAADGEVIVIDGCRPNAHDVGAGLCECDDGYVEGSDGTCVEEGGEIWMPSIVFDPCVGSDCWPGPGGGGDDGKDTPSDCTETEVFNEETSQCEERTCTGDLFECQDDAFAKATLCYANKWTEAYRRCTGTGRLPNGRNISEYGGWDGVVGATLPGGVTASCPATAGAACIEWWTSGIDCFTLPTIVPGVAVSAGSDGASYEVSLEVVPQDQTFSGGSWAGTNQTCHNQEQEDIAQCDANYEKCEDDGESMMSVAPYRFAVPPRTMDILK